VGDEADLYASTSRPASWSSSDYTAQFLGWTSFLTQNLSLPQNMFEAGNFARAPPDATMNVVEIIDEGIYTTGAVKLFGQRM